MNESRIQKLTTFLEEDSQDSFSRFALALEHLKAGESDTALKHFEYIQLNDPDYVGVYYHLGKLYQQIGESEKALKTVTTGIAVAREAQNHHAATELEQALNEIETEE